MNYKSVKEQLKIAKRKKKEGKGRKKREKRVEKGKKKEKREIFFVELCVPKYKQARGARRAEGAARSENSM